MYGEPSWLDTAGRLLIVFCFVTTGLCNISRIILLGNTGILGGLLLLLGNLHD
jgi:hypothetical protein